MKVLDGSKRINKFLDGEFNVNNRMVLANWSRKLRGSLINKCVKEQYMYERSNTPTKNIKTIKIKIYDKLTDHCHLDLQIIIANLSLPILKFTVFKN